jgi:bile acid-coenzyme A ligase
MTAGQATIALKTVGEIVDRFATLAPTEAVITTIDREGDEDAISRQMLSAWSDGLAQALVDAGVGVGDLVPIHLPTGNAFIAAAVGIFKAGGTPMPVSDRLPDAELSHLLDLADAKVVLSNTLTTVNRIDVDSLRNESLAENSQGAIAPPRQVHVSNPTKALASGGSTGKPKLIITTGEALFDPDNPIIPMLMRFEPSDLKYSPGPLYHNGPFWFSINMLLRGGRLLLNERFNAHQCLENIERYKPSVLNLVPTMMQRLLREPRWHEADLSSVRIAWHLAAPCPAWAKEGFIDKLGGAAVLELWAATEANGLTIIDGDEWLTHRGSVGKPVGTEVLIVDENRNIMPQGEVGEIFTRMAGTAPPCEYRGANSLDMLEGGFSSVGDLGWLDDEGYLYLADRRTDLIISGGANIFPAEVEAVISQHPKVKDVAVVGLKDEDLGRRVHAIVEAFDAGDPPNLEALFTLCAEQLVRYKVPRTIELIDALPRNDAGKIRRSQLRDERETEST